MLADDAELQPRDTAEIAATMRRGGRPPATTRSQRCARCAGVRRTELLRTAFADLLGRRDVDEVCAAISATTEATAAGGAAGRAAVGRRDAAASSSCRCGSRSSRWAASAATRPATARTPTCCSCTSRLPAMPDPAVDAGASRPAGGRRSCAALLSAPSADRSAAGHRRRPAPGRAATDRWSAALASYAALLRALVVGVGGAGAAAGAVRAPATPDLGARFVDADRPGAVPGRRSGRPTIVEIRRLKARIDTERLPRGADPSHAHQARPGRPGRRRVDDPAAAAASTVTTSPALRTTGTLEALAAAAAAAAADQRAGRRARGGVAAGDRGPQRRHARARPGRATSFRTRAWRFAPWAGCSAIRRGSTRAKCSTTIAGPRAARAASSRRSSTPDRRLRACAAVGGAQPGYVGSGSPKSGASSGGTNAPCAGQERTGPRTPAPGQPPHPPRR